MLIVTGVIALVLGLMGWVGQAISVVNFPLAQRLGLQEKSDETDPLFRRLELETARWDLLVLWTLPVAGALMLVDHSLWPYLALIAGGINVDTAGREAAKRHGLRSKGVKVGGEREGWIFLAYMWTVGVLGLWIIIYALLHLV